MQNFCAGEQGLPQLGQVTAAAASSVFCCRGSSRVPQRLQNFWAVLQRFPQTGQGRSAGCFSSAGDFQGGILVPQKLQNEDPPLTSLPQPGQTAIPLR